MKKIFLLTATALIALLSLTGCSGKKENSLHRKVNQFSAYCIRNYYLWDEALPENIYATDEYPSSFFNRYKWAGDEWSMITDDIRSFSGSVSNTGLTFGYSLISGRFVDGSGEPTGEYFVMVEFVYPGSPAAVSGLERGDVILKINGQPITASNIRMLTGGQTLTLTVGSWENGSLSGNTSNVTLNPCEMYLDPVVKYRMIEKSGHKIGYLFYADYVLNSHDRLRQVIEEFKTEQITDLVLDLRSNGGGTSATAEYLCNMVAPSQVVSNEEIMYTHIYSTRYTEYLHASGQWESESVVRFRKDVPVNLGLSRIYILTGPYTASASELTITSLMPYMDVNTIGSTTHGKSVGGYILQAGTVPVRDASISNWGMYLMTFQYINSEGYTDFWDGISPEEINKVPEDYRDMKPLGDESDPLLARALELITGIPSPSSAMQEGARGLQFLPDTKLTSGVAPGILLGDKIITADIIN